MKDQFSIGELMVVLDSKVSENVKNLRNTLNTKQIIRKLG